MWIGYKQYLDKINFMKVGDSIRVINVVYAFELL